MMKFILFFIMQLTASFVFADVFYLSQGKSTRLIITKTDDTIEHQILSNHEKVEIIDYKKICAVSPNHNYEILIEEINLSLKKDYPCHIHTLIQSLPSENNTLLESSILLFNWIKNSMSLELNNKALVVAEGRADNDIEISKSQHPRMAFQFTDNTNIKLMILQSIDSDGTVQEQVIPQEELLQLPMFKVGQRYAIQMQENNGAIAFSQTFKVVK